jgi:hypothetical protein
MFDKLKCFLGHHRYIKVASYSGWFTDIRTGAHVSEAVFKKCRCSRCGHQFAQGVSADHVMDVNIDYFDMCERKLNKE